MLRKNQICAIEISKKNDFESGIHNHTTGSGKSWIAMNIVDEFNKKYPKCNVLWICEKKNILIEQFSNNNIEERNFSHILNKFNVINFVIHKKTDWYNSLNISQCWKKPFLCIINRTYLTTKDKYTNINIPIDLIIHDECHSIENTTTQKFYKWLEIHNNKFSIKSRIIGFSATPETINPLHNILSTYSIYDAFKDNVILPPKIVWLKSVKEPQIDHLIILLKMYIDQLYYKKIIVWCGLIDVCIKTAELWSNYFSDYKFCIDFNKNDNSVDKYKNYDYFYKCEEKCILFCAVKHREGSDIPNIDGCIFMDNVEKRSKRVFTQCIGRVLRKDKNNKKQYGLIIDLKIKNTIELCNRIQSYLKLENIFPWDYNIYQKNINKYTYYLNELIMINKDKINKDKINKDKINKDKINKHNDEQTIELNEKTSKYDKKFTKEDIYKYFIRPVSNSDKYIERLNYEIDLILSKDLFRNILYALDILELTKDIPHITRGSCGSSLVCYLLGISHVDPIEHNISFARFLNIYRNNLPDIDFDFPHYLRDEVFLKLYQKWGNKVVRISNHNYYHEKSALRASLHINGIRHFISKYNIFRTIENFDENLKDKIYKKQKELEGTFKGYSLHCGGILYYPEGIPEENILETSNSKIIKQVNLDKNDVSKKKHFKIDILSSRGLSQLYYCRHFNLINFNTNIGDTKTIELLCSGNNIGITLAETPLMRKALLLIKPKTINDLAICLAIIRPAASDTKKMYELGVYDSNSIVYDDDMIYILAELFECEEAYADKIRRGYSKNDEEMMKLINKKLYTKSPSYKKKIETMLKNMRKYSFCKAHALSYAQLVWQLAYEKAHNPRRFWKSTLKNVNSCYRNWVHIYEAKCNNVEIIHANKSVYSENKKNNINLLNSKYEQLQKYGYWIMNNTKFFKGCYYINSNNNILFNGLIASSRMLNYNNNKKLILFIGVEKNKYIELIINNIVNFNNQKVIVKGIGTLINELYNTVECENYNIKFF